MYFVEETLTCSSENGMYLTCPIFTGVVYSIHSLVEIDNTHCIKDVDYGITNTAHGNYIWVDNDCHGTFTVEVAAQGMLFFQLMSLVVG